MYKSWSNIQKLVAKFQWNYLHISYNSCRNRHRQKRRGQQREAWMEASQEDLLPVLPCSVYIAASHQGDMPVSTGYGLQSFIQYSMGYHTTFAADAKYLGATTGMITILHTWSQTLSLLSSIVGASPGLQK